MRTWFITSIFFHRRVFRYSSRVSDNGSGKRLLLALLIFAGAVGSSFGQKGSAPALVSFATQDGGTIYGDLYGKGKHGVVLVHGGRFNKQSWARQATELAKSGFRVLAIDLRGYGKSTGPGQNDVFSAPLHLDVLAAVKYLRDNGARSVSLLGGSLGGGASGDAVAHAKAGEISRMISLAGFWSHKGGEDITAPLLVIMTREDKNSEGLRLPRIQREFDKVPAPKKLVILEGDAHAQFMFDTPDSGKIMKLIIKFLKKR